MRARGADRSGLRGWLGKAWFTVAALAVVLLLHDCAATDAEREAGLADLGMGMVLKADGTVVDASVLAGSDPGAFAASAPPGIGWSFLPLPVPDAWDPAPWAHHARAGWRD